MISEGKLDEVAKMAEDSLKKQMGGKIVSQQEASQSEQAAAQYQKQLMLVRQGPLGQFAQDEQSAMKLVESFSKGAKIDGKELKPLVDKNTLLEQTMKTGQQIQDTTNSRLNALNNTMQMLTHDISKTQAESGRRIVGNGAEQRYLARDDSMRYHVGEDATQKSLVRASVELPPLAASGLKELVAPAKSLVQTVLKDLGKVEETIEKAMNDSPFLKPFKAIFEKDVNTKLDPNLNKEETAKAEELRQNIIKQKLEEQKKIAEEKARKEEQTQHASAPTYPKPKADEPKTDDHSAHTTTDSKKGSGLSSAAHEARQITLIMSCPECHKKHHVDANEAANPGGGKS